MGQVDKIVFIQDISKITGQDIYNIQFTGQDNVPRYLGMIPAAYLNTALWFYSQEKMNVEVQQTMTLQKVADELGYDLDKLAGDDE